MSKRLKIHGTTRLAKRGDVSGRGEKVYYYGASYGRTLEATLKMATQMVKDVNEAGYTSLQDVKNYVGERPQRLERRAVVLTFTEAPHENVLGLVAL